VEQREGHSADPQLDRLGRVLEAQSAKLFRITLPVLCDLDAQVEVNLCAQDLLDLAACRGTHFAQRAPPLPIDDALLAGPLDIEHREHVDQVVTALPRVDLIDHHANECGSSSRTPSRAARE